MILLGFDTTTTMCSAALWSEGDILSHRQVDAEKQHAEILVPMLTDIVQAHDLSLAMVDVFATTVGPGSFTGIRVGLSTARGLSLASGRSLITFSTLEVLAASVSVSAEMHMILSTLDARRNRLYAQWFDNVGCPISDPGVVDSEQLRESLPPGRDRAIVVGTGAEAALGALSDVIDTTYCTAVIYPDARTLVRLAATKARVDTSNILSPPRPLYLRDSGARVPTSRLGSLNERT